MVLLAAAVCSKQGKALVSRQFVEMSRARIEGLLSAFPKLIGSSEQQHTFVETESVRYVYQPLDKLFVLLITTKASNILEDLETLRLFSRVVPEYCRVLDDADILEHAFELLFAFDEIVALGYRENVNLAQIRTFIEMDSHEERVINAVRKTQELEAKEMMKRKAKELTAARQGSKAKSLITGIAGGMGAQTPPVRSEAPTKALEVGDTASSDVSPPKQVIKPSGGKALRLGGKSKDVDVFVDKLVSEGTAVAESAAKPIKKSAPAAATTPQSDVHLKFEEKLSLTCGRHGGLQNMEVRGMCLLNIHDVEKTKIAMRFQNDDKFNFQFQTHPNVDKKLYTSQSVIGLKPGAVKGFPIGTETGVIKWRLQSKDDEMIPLTINCWPNENGEECEVTIEYELLMKELELKDVTISIPLPSSVGAPVIGELSGDYTYDARKSTLIWQTAVIDENSTSGSLEFTIAGVADDFFPITVDFYSNKLVADVAIPSIYQQESDAPVKFSQERSLVVEKYEIV